MRFSFALLLAASFSHFLFAQSPREKPEPIGGFDGLTTFLLYNARTPLNHSGGSVIVKGTVKADGSLSNIQIEKGVDQSLDKEAMRLMSLFNAWKPAFKDNRPIESGFTHTVIFLPKSDPNYQRERGGFTFYFDKKLKENPAENKREFRVIVPADEYGVPIPGRIEISTKTKNDWTVTDEGSVKYEPIEMTAYQKKDYPGVNLFHIKVNSGSFPLNLPNYIITGQGQVIDKSAFPQETSTYYQNGILSSVTIKRSESNGEEYRWHKNGVLKAHVEHINIYREAWLKKVLGVFEDQGNSMLKNGYLKGSDLFAGEGTIKDGFQSGTWKSVDSTGKVYFEEEYLQGKLIKGVSYREGKEFHYQILEKQPEFSGGVNEMYRFISRELVYPPDAAARKKQGRVIVRFTIRPNGSVDDIITQTSLGYGLEEAARDVVAKMSGKWQPGLQKGIPVPVRYTIPVTFRLN